MSWLRSIAVVAFVLAGFGWLWSAVAAGVGAPASWKAGVSAFELVAATFSGASAETSPPPRGSGPRVWRRCVKLSPCPGGVAEAAIPGKGIAPTAGTRTFQRLTDSIVL